MIYVTTNNFSFLTKIAIGIKTKQIGAAKTIFTTSQTRLSLNTTNQTTHTILCFTDEIAREEPQFHQCLYISKEKPMEKFGKKYNFFLQCVEMKRLP